MLVAGCMFRLVLRAICFWLCVFELLAGWRGWRGLSWFGVLSARRVLMVVAFVVVRVPWRERWRLMLALAVMVVPSLVVQGGLASLRGRSLDRLVRLVPGHYPDRRIDRLDLPMAHGYLPALHVVPASGTDAAVCVVHGSGCDKTSYVWRLVEVLIRRGVAVLLIDLDGHGENPRLQSYPAIVEDATVAVGWLRERYARVALLGISLGGCVSARAVAEGVVVDALVLMEAPPQLVFTRGDMWREGLALVQPALLDIFCDCTVATIVRAWYAAPIRATIGTWDLIAALDLVGSVRCVRAPLLLLYGDRDAIVTLAQAEQVRRAAPQGVAFHVVRGASHLTLIVHSEALATLGDWLVATLWS